MNHTLTDADVWTFLAAGCNAAEIAAFAGIATSTAAAWIAHVRCQFARAA